LGTDSGVVVISNNGQNISPAAALTVAQTLTGGDSGDQFYLVIGNGVDSAIYHVAETDGDPTTFETAELMVTFSGVSDVETLHFGDYLITA
jgi:hypothetical protein